MNIIETLAYAGLGLASEAEEKFKEKFDELVEAGKKADEEGKNYVGDFFKTMDASKEDFQREWDKNKEKLEEKFPFLKEIEDKILQAKEDITAKAKETKDKMSSSKEDIEEATVVEETK